MYLDKIDLEMLRRKMEETSCLVLGDVMLDRYIYGEVRRISPEAPVPVVDVRGTKENLGGAANVAANLREFGCNVFLYGILGKDSMGETVERELKHRNIVYRGLKTEERPTTCKSRIVGKSQQIVRFDEEIYRPLSLQDETMLLSDMEPLFKCAGLIVISDYAKGVCTPGLCRKIISQASCCQIKVVIDPKGTEWEKYKGAFMVTPNWKEFTAIAGPINPEEDEAIKKGAVRLLETYELEYLLITRSERGMILASKDLFLPFPAQAREVSDVSGAGDTAIAALSAFLTAGAPLKPSVYWANRSAGLAVERAGTSVIGIKELLKEQDNLPASFDYTSKIMSWEQLQEELSRQRKRKARIVFTNGCFDILHTGHIQYLGEAKSLGDFLIVAVNTDESVKRQNKGNDRPVNREMDRAMQLAALMMVDAVVIFGEGTPLELIKQVRPDILVKGGDYKVEEIVGREYSGETRVLSFKRGYSTTGLLEGLTARWERSRAQLSCVAQWLGLMEQGAGLLPFFEGHHSTKIAVYGAAELARLLKKELDQTGKIEIVYFIDQHAQKQREKWGKPVYLPQEYTNAPEVDMVVVTVVSSFEAIEESLLHIRPELPVISLSAVVDARANEERTWA